MPLLHTHRDSKMISKAIFTKLEHVLVQCPIWLHCFIGLTVRVALMGYGIWQDSIMKVKYTDIDYSVFTDAADFVVKGCSPYQRATYRYTPLLAWLLTPNILVTPHFGKMVFIIFDIISALLIYRILITKGCISKTAKLCTSLWLYNPLPMTVSSRGNAESIMSCLVLLTLFLLLKKKIKMAAFMYALSVHMKIYPITYAVSIYLNLREPVSAPRSFIQRFIENVKPNLKRVTFVLISGFTFLCLLVFFFYFYGWTFLQETYLYHITRKDIRHNFSVYFYMLYLTDQKPYSGWISLFTFLPQAILIASFSLKFYKDLSFTWFLITFAFVTFNKVVTSQYFLWYLSLIPMVIPDLHLGAAQGVGILVLWFAGQILWLVPAYYLEFEGVNTFIYIWLAGLLFFTINVSIMGVFIVKYQDHRTSKEKVF